MAKIEREAKLYSDNNIPLGAETLVMKKRRIEEPKTKKLGEKRQKTFENNVKSKDEIVDKENLDPAKQTNKLENNKLKDKENIINNWFNITEKDRAQKGISILETQLGSKDDTKSSRKSSESEPNRIISGDTNVIEYRTGKNDA
ncbi:17177_t:CDS:2 [Dentiscutata heterogama]|uniref:17177_t:CDS:1 n=1 Tax=Dentiscutata heterogama TaxID=1316150 RepID=A0ACA9KXF5_9GLOM|nr:17177_t:CDS:2 [Dentiscutata heterogama]